MVAYAVSQTPNDLKGWPQWKRYVMAICNAVDGDADALSEIVHEFSKRWTEGEYDAAFTDKCIEEVCGCPPDRIGAGTVYGMADKAHPVWRDEYDVIVTKRLGEALSFKKEWKAKSSKNQAAPNEKLKAISLQDFVSHLPGSGITYVYLPTMEHWSAAAVDTQLPSMPLLKKNGNPVLDSDGKPKKISASSWLDKNRPVQQMTWTPAEPMLIVDKLIADGGWFVKPKATCLNLYRPPRIKPGDATKAGPWVELVQKIYPEDYAHLFKYFAQRRQRPGDKINHAVMLGGPPGIGKDTILAALKQAVGPWNFSEISPHNLFEAFNPHIKSVVLRISEARDLGDVNRYALLEHTKTLMAAPPDVLRCNEKNLRQYYIVNVTGVIITTNHKTDGIYLPADDRRHFVAWSPLTKEDFAPDFWKKFWHWYEHGGYEHVAAWLDEYDLTDFDCKRHRRRQQHGGTSSPPTVQLRKASLPTCWTSWEMPTPSRSMRFILEPLRSRFRLQKAARQAASSGSGWPIQESQTVFVPDGGLRICPGSERGLEARSLANPRRAEGHLRQSGAIDSGSP